MIVVKTEIIKQILQNLLDIKKVGYYTRADIEKAIMLSRGVDKRTIQNWFDVLWKLEYFLQPQPGVFNLNLEKVVALEVKIPPQIDMKQKRLGEF
jgi:hypothetical protein